MRDVRDEDSDRFEYVVAFFYLTSEIVKDLSRQAI